MQLDIQVQTAAYEMMHHFTQSAGPIVDTQLHLPTSLGGLAIESCTDKVWPACLAAHAKSWPHVERTFRLMAGRKPHPDSVQRCLEPATQSQESLPTDESTKVSVTGHAVAPKGKSHALALHDLRTGGKRDIQKNVTHAMSVRRQQAARAASAHSPEDMARLLSCAEATAAP